VKQEEINQEVRNGDLVVVATAKLREKVLERIRRLIDGVHYVALSDLLREINEIRIMLSRLRGGRRRYAVAVAAEIAQSIMLALLLIPERQKAIDVGGGSEHTGSAESAKVVEDLAKAEDGARRVADKLWGSKEATPTIEAWDRELSKLGERRELSEHLLVAPRTEDGKVHDSNGRPLVEIPPAPKSLPSTNNEEVELQVRSVDADPGLAIVKVLRAANPDGPAMKGLFDRRLRLVFEEEVWPGIAKFLELAQYTDFPATP
jgi:hypothetical protein